MMTETDVKLLMDELFALGPIPKPLTEWAEFCLQTQKRDLSSEWLEIAASSLLGFAASTHLPQYGYMIVRSGKTDSGESDEEGNIIWCEWCYEVYKHSWGNGDDYFGEFATYDAAMLFCIKKIKGIKA